MDQQIIIMFHVPLPVLEALLALYYIHYCPQLSDQVTFFQTSHSDMVAAPTNGTQDITTCEVDQLPNIKI